MIIWLSSYPKSGNTLLRSILATYFYSQDGNVRFNYLNRIEQFPSIDHFKYLGIDLSNEKEVFQNFIEAQKFINKRDNNIKFMKTHASLSRINNCNFTDFNNSLGTIYLIRDPRNVVTSFAHHYNIDVNEATDVIIDPGRWLVRTELVCKTFLSSWNINYNSWKQFNHKVLFVKYEDLVSKKKTTLLKIFKFINNLGIDKFNVDMEKLNKVIKSSNFVTMQNLEKKEDFKESIMDTTTKKRKTFFKLGPKNDWKKLLDEKNRIKIETAFQKEMKELGYL